VELQYSLNTGASAKAQQTVHRRCMRTSQQAVSTGTRPQCTVLCCMDALQAVRTGSSPKGFLEEGKGSSTRVFCRTLPPVNCAQEPGGEERRNSGWADVPKENPLTSRPKSY